jgi:hypothetical protein
MTGSTAGGSAGQAGVRQNFGVHQVGPSEMEGRTEWAGYFGSRPIYVARDRGGPGEKEMTAEYDVVQGNTKDRVRVRPCRLDLTSQVDDRAPLLLMAAGV